MQHADDTGCLGHCRCSPFGSLAMKMCQLCPCTSRYCPHEEMRHEARQREKETLLSPVPAVRVQGVNCYAAASASVENGHARHLPLLFFRTDEAPGFPYGDKVVFLANDWHAGLVPTYIAGKYRQHGVYKVRGSAMAANIQDPRAEGPEGGCCILTGGHQKDHSDLHA